MGAGMRPFLEKKTMSRLTKSIREEILTNIARAKLYPVLDALAERETVLANKIYAAMYDRYKLPTLPQNLFHFSHAIHVIGYEAQDSVKQHRRHLRFSLGTSKAVAHQREDINSYWPAAGEVVRAVAKNNTAVDISNLPIIKDYLAFVADSDAESARWKTLAESMMAVMNSVSSFKRLLVIWPDVEEFLPKTESSNPLSINIGNINDQLAAMSAD